MITLSAFKWVPPFAQGLVRDLRVRWALEEAGIPYRERLIGPEDKASAGYRALQPFGQVPAIEDGWAQAVRVRRHRALHRRTVRSADARGPGRTARTRAWVFAALNSVEPAVEALADLDLFHAGEKWAAEGRPAAEKAVHKRLDALEDWLGDRALARGPVHGRRSDDDDRAARPAPNRNRVGPP